MTRASVRKVDSVAVGDILVGLSVGHSSVEGRGDGGPVAAIPLVSVHMVSQAASPIPRPWGTTVALILLAATVVTQSACRSRQASAFADRVAAEDAVSAAHDAVVNTARADALESGILAAAADAERCAFGPLQWLTGLDPEVRQGLADIVSSRLSERRRQLAVENARLTRLIEDEVLPAWRRCAAVRLEQAFKADEAEREARKAQQTALALGTENRWFWLAGIVAVAGLLLVFAIDRRQEIRRYFNGGRARDLGLGKLLCVAFAIMCLLTIALFFASDGILVDLLDRGPGGTHVAAVAAERQRDAEAAEAAKVRYERQIAAVAAKKADLGRQFKAIVSDGALGSLFDEWWSSWEAASEQRGRLVEIAASEGRFKACRTAVDPDQAGSVAAEIKSYRDTAAKWRRGASVTCGFIGVGLLGLVAGGFLWLLRGISRRTSELGATCPLCLAKGKLEAGPGGADTLQCRNVISESPFEECNFDFPAMYRTLPKLSFPTLGVPSSGKTHWLAMVYRQLNQNQDVPPEVEFAKIRSQASEEFDRIVDDILLSKRGPAATQTSVLPHPLVFNFVDQDRLGRSNLLVNIFDYSGEVVRKTSLDDHQRRRAFTADGYFFFLDPIKTSDEQTAPLANFRQDVRIVKKLRAGQQIHCPVALCVPKIDLLTGQPYADPAGGDAVDLFYREIGEIGWGMDQKSIQARSTLMRNLRDTIWPGWEIEKTIDDIFGGRYMFFPFTPVGLDGMGEDWTAGNRVISPVGTLHPLMWLLHMNGYPVLPRAAAK